MRLRYHLLSNWQRQPIDIYGKNLGVYQTVTGAFYRPRYQSVVTSIHEESRSDRSEPSNSSNPSNSSKRFTIKFSNYIAAEKFIDDIYRARRLSVPRSRSTPNDGKEQLLTATQGEEPTDSNGKIKSNLMLYLAGDKVWFEAVGSLSEDTEKEWMEFISILLTREEKLAELKIPLFILIGSDISPITDVPADQAMNLCAKPDVALKLLKHHWEAYTNRHKEQKQAAQKSEYQWSLKGIYKFGCGIAFNDCNGDMRPICVQANVICYAILREIMEGLDKRSDKYGLKLQTLLSHTTRGGMGEANQVVREMAANAQLQAQEAAERNRQLEAKNRQLQFEAEHMRLQEQRISQEPSTKTLVTAAFTSSGLYPFFSDPDWQSLQYPEPPRDGAKYSK